MFGEKLRSFLCAVTGVFAAFFATAQEIDTNQIKQLEEVVVSGYNEGNPWESSMILQPLKIDSLISYGHFNLTDLLARQPGMSMLSTGVGIAKPVIRGLYGNRVLVLLSGLKFDNQQWQEEHGLGLSDMGLDRVELIKGPVGILYGSEALGGLINLVEEAKPEAGKSVRDVSLRFNSNTLGGQIQAGYKVNRGKNWFRVRVNVENNADYQDGNNQRVINSRFDGVQLKSTYGFQRKYWVSTNNYMSTFNRFGFIFNDIYDFVIPDNRYSRKLSENPYHLVLLNILSSENKIRLKNGSLLNINVGIQSNERMENEGGGAISLNMHLITGQYLIRLERTMGEASKLILSHLSSIERNTNYGSRKIVPDAWMQESNVSAYLELRLGKKLIIENGLGAGEKWVKTTLTPFVNTQEKDIDPFSVVKPYANFFSGLTFFSKDRFNCKINLSSGVRIPNLAELSSNGLHEGIFTYEIGDPTLKTEKLFSANFFLNYQRAWFTFSLSPFYNHFIDYIYLTPTQEEWNGFPVCRYKQQDADQYGGEATLDFRIVQPLHVSVAYSGMTSYTADGNYTPYIPAQKVSSNLIYQHSLHRLKLRYTVTADCFARQNQVAPNEIATPSYFLLHAGITCSTGGAMKRLQVSLKVNNILNKAYYDHLSRFKALGLLNIGRSVSLGITYQF